MPQKKYDLFRIIKRSYKRRGSRRRGAVSLPLATRIGVVAPASRINENTAERVRAIGTEFGADLFFHPQCFLTCGHFAGEDSMRSYAFVEVANNPSVDALWWARGGYGANRIVGNVLPRLNEVARHKLYLGYSDAGFLLSALYNAGFRVAHGPVARDLEREGGQAAIARALRFLTGKATLGDLEPSVHDGLPLAAFNLTILSHLLGTPWEPNLASHILLLEDVSEPMYAVDRALFHVTSSPGIRKVAGIKLGRISDVPPNDPDFGQTEDQVTRHWCTVNAIPYLGRADIGHDAENKIVPFGAGPR
ncbi:MAG: LD-carboxypeptidase [Alphaproteobacteria bacterium]|nr:LD-carboxypeptidase [Alphaproteobacteria bacterium]